MMMPDAPLPGARDRSAQRERLAREGMYRPEFESDACGVGLVAAAIDALKAVWHRGASIAAGDIVRGASLVVWAIRDGRDVVDRMHVWLKGKAQVKAMTSEKVAT
ncbi:hypothetical protein GVO57_13810 [Sphingomonas changnyeongensis]|uniref:Glutamine amidotransferase type-2 domain-containing protein n=1 Tax=Sphingomonas changnyeongensis TaxID=2698679 RepID=A0A7Z2NXJ4_9SPHN|nr:hypothetical protein [Sphingomonas changnyeongensis]QHL91673.1 hypothetical protein GVO57_13810 [Sphingomonas changnyeongensis]